MIIDIPDSIPVVTVLEFAKSLGLKTRYNRGTYVMRKDHGPRPDTSNVRFLRAKTPDDEPTPPSAA